MFSTPHPKAHSGPGTPACPPASICNHRRSGTSCSHARLHAQGKLTDHTWNAARPNPLGACSAHMRKRVYCSVVNNRFCMSADIFPSGQVAPACPSRHPNGGNVGAPLHTLPFHTLLTIPKGTSIYIPALNMGLNLTAYPMFEATKRMWGPHTPSEKLDVQKLQRDQAASIRARAFGRSPFGESEGTSRRISSNTMEPPQMGSAKESQKGTFKS